MAAAAAAAHMNYTSNAVSMDVGSVKSEQPNPLDLLTAYTLAKKKTLTRGFLQKLYPDIKVPGFNDTDIVTVEELLGIIAGKYYSFFGKYLTRDTEIDDYLINFYTTLFEKINPGGLSPGLVEELENFKSKPLKGGGKRNYKQRGGATWGDVASAAVYLANKAIASVTTLATETVPTSILAGAEIAANNAKTIFKGTSVASAVYGVHAGFIDLTAVTKAMDVLIATLPDAAMTNLMNAFGKLSTISEIFTKASILSGYGLFVFLVGLFVWWYGAHILNTGIDIVGGISEFVTYVLTLAGVIDSTGKPAINPETKETVITTEELKKTQSAVIVAAGFKDPFAVNPVDGTYMAFGGRRRRSHKSRRHRRRSAQRKSRRHSRK
jgi:hypothetical protein